MVERCARRHRSRRGSILLGVLAFVAIVAMVIIGVLNIALSHYQRVKTENDYASALYLAEAGVNYEINKVSLDPRNTQGGIDQASQTSPSGPGYTLAGSRFQVYCANKDGSTPWVPSKRFMITATGTVGAASRTVRVMVRGVNSPGSGDFAVFAINDVTLSDDPSTFWGDIGTNGKIYVSAGPTIHGKIYLNGPAASFSGGVPVRYNGLVFSKPSPVTWPTVDEIANDAFPGGLSYLATHNDNAKVGLGTALNKAMTLKAGNYYVNSISLSSAKLTLDNTAGPVNIWVGPSGGTGNVDLNSVSALVKLSQTPNVHIYVATKGLVHLYGTSTIDAGIYAYNKDASGHGYGTVTTDDIPQLNGQVMAYSVNFTSNVNVTSVGGLFQTSDYLYYTFDGRYSELNGM